MRYLIRPLGAWTDPVTGSRLSSSVFRASWDSTLRMLRDEVDALDGQYPVVIQVDVTEADLRADGMLRARARVGPNPGVIVSFTSRRGPLRYATDAYDQRWSGAMAGWQANVRAIALALGALRAVDRYGVSRRGEQYAGWRAIGTASSYFTDPADARKFLRRIYAEDNGAPPQLLDAALYKQLAVRHHPDHADGSREVWDRLEEAARLLEIR